MGNVFSGTFDFKSVDNFETLTFRSVNTNESGAFKGIDTGFEQSTLIATTSGERAVKDLQRGDRVITRDNGIQEICWIGQRKITFGDMSHNPDLKPVMIRKGALGPGLPEKDIVVSPLQGILITNAFLGGLDESEVLIPARFLVGFEGIEIAEVISETYYFIMFEQHEVVLSNGIWSESLKPSAEILSIIDETERCEIVRLFPKLETQCECESRKSARRSLKQDEAVKLVG